MSDDGDEMETFKILLSTDNHLGYAEKDPVRGNDTFRTFEEILKVAKKEQVDLVLLGGDLFHDNKPSRRTMYRTMNLLRKYCMGNGSIRFRIMSDQSINFPNYGIVNYEDPNYNIELPIFSIHGNHDDPTREGGMKALAALDLLSVANMVNYFGKSDKVDDIDVFPILMTKGSTKLAIYGLGNMRDERLNRMFSQRKVKFHRPGGSDNEWFNIFVVHQNRDNRGRGTKNCVHESFIPDFIDFVMWGHEHECLIELQESLRGKFFITQPGSSVATSLIEGESREKKIGILEVRGQNFRMKLHPLKSVRPFILDEIILADYSELDPNDPDVADKINEVLSRHVHKMIRQYVDEAENNELNQDSEILVRLKVEHSGFPVLNNQRFGSKFVAKVANPNNILLFHRRRSRQATMPGKRGLDNPIRPANMDSLCVEDLIAKKLDTPEQKLFLLPEPTLNVALEDFVQKNIPSAINEVVERVLDGTKRSLTKDKATMSIEDIHNIVEKNTERTRAEANVETEKESKELETSSPGSKFNTSETSSLNNSGVKKKISRSRSSQAKFELEDSDNVISATTDSITNRKRPTQRIARKSKVNDENQIDDMEADYDSCNEKANRVLPSESPKAPPKQPISLSSDEEFFPTKQKSNTPSRRSKRRKITQNSVTSKNKEFDDLSDEVMDEASSDASPIRRSSRSTRTTMSKSKRAIGKSTKSTQPTIASMFSQSQSQSQEPNFRSTRGGRCIPSTPFSTRNPDSMDEDLVISEGDDDNDDNGRTQLTAPPKKRKLPLSMSQKSAQPSGSQLLKAWGRARNLKR